MSEPQGLYNIGLVDHIKLKPCLHCNGKGLFAHEQYAYGRNSLTYYVICDKCDERVSFSRDGYANYDFITCNPEECEVRDWENVAFLWNEKNLTIEDLQERQQEQIMVSDQDLNLFNRGN